MTWIPTARRSESAARRAPSSLAAINPLALSLITADLRIAPDYAASLTQVCQSWYGMLTFQPAPCLIGPPVPACALPDFVTISEWQ